MIGNFKISNSLTDWMKKINEDKEVELSSGEEQVGWAGPSLPTSPVPGSSHLTQFRYAMGAPLPASLVCWPIDYMRTIIPSNALLTGVVLLEPHPESFITINLPSLPRNLSENWNLSTLERKLGRKGLGRVICRVPQKANSTHRGSGG